MRSILLAYATIAPALLLADEDALLSRNATYRVIGEAYLYARQHLPGTNGKAKNTSGYRKTPLVEITDTGDVLIDGDTKTAIYTDWFWKRGGKRITVEMTLPGPSKVSRVVVRLPENPTLRPQDIRLDVRSIGDKWTQVDLIQTGPKAALAPAETRKESHTFLLPQVQCQQVRVMCVDQAIVNPQCGIAEVEIYGHGPTRSDHRGLIRSEPHIKSITQPKPNRPAGSQPLGGSGQVKVRLSGPAVDPGDGELVIDGDRATLVQIDNKRFSNSQLTIEIDLGKPFVIDSVNVWLPGGKGVESGHANDLQLAISPSPDAVDWKIPTDRVLNPYWPDDDAPRPYPIPIGNLNTIGQRIRVTASLSGAGGRTSRLSVAEVEIWGRQVDPGEEKQISARLNIEPIIFAPEAVGKLHPKLRWMVTEKIRNGRIKGNLFDPLGNTGKTKGQALAEAGFNLISCLMMPNRDQRSVSTEVTKKLPANVAVARRLGLKYAVVWHYGSSHQNPYRRYRGTDGILAKRSCCPLDDEYFQRHVGRWAVAIVKGGADGVIIDTEMYESDQTRYPGPCVCDQCFKIYLTRFSNSASTLFDQVAAQRRGLWLTTNGAMDHYTDFSAKRIELIYDRLREQCQRINPAFFFGHSPFLEYLPGIERGLGTSSSPCVLFSGHEYTYGIRDVTYRDVRRVRQTFPALYVCGFFLHYHTPEMVETNGLIGSLYADGWWLYHMMHVLNHLSAAESHLAERVKGTEAMDYFRQITRLHQRLDALGNEPIESWPRPDGLPEDFPLSIDSLAAPKPGE